MTWQWCQRQPAELRTDPLSGLVLFLACIPWEESLVVIAGKSQWLPSLHGRGQGWAVCDSDTPCCVTASVTSWGCAYCLSWPFDLGLNKCSASSGVTLKGLMCTWWVWVSVRKYTAIFRGINCTFRMVSISNWWSCARMPNLWFQSYFKFCWTSNFRALFVFGHSLCLVCWQLGLLLLCLLKCLEIMFV